MVRGKSRISRGIPYCRHPFKKKFRPDSSDALHLVNPMCTIYIVHIKFSILIIICVLLISCDGGLAPLPPVQPGFGGTITFTPGSWPPADSLVSLYVFASKIYPLDSAKVFNGLFSIPPEIFLYPDFSTSLPYFVDSVSYFFPLSSGTYKYVGVIQQVSSDLVQYGIRVFRVVGFYEEPLHQTNPGTVIVDENNQLNNINIRVDFLHPPPQPF